jgi:ABC-2 type transport system permease protein
MMRATLAIAGRELRSYFVSPVAYILIGLFLFLTGYFFYSSLIEFANQALRAEQQSGMFGGGSTPMSVNEWVVRPFFYNVAVISLFLVPMITMRLLCEEKKTGTIELLLTSPITELEITIGKFLAGFGLYALMLLGTGAFMAILFVYGKPDPGPILTGYAGLLLLGAASLALGTFVSSLTENPIVAGFSGFVLLLVLWLMHWGAEYATGTTAALLNYLSVVRHFEDPAKGVLDTRNLVFYLSLTGFGLFATMRAIESVRWKA